MDGSGSAGSPSAASSRSLPANKEMLKPADWISASEEDEGQSRESVSLPGSQNHQSPPKALQSPAEIHLTAKEPDQLGLTKHKNHEDPPTKKTKPGDSLTRADLPTGELRLGNSPPTDKKKTKDRPSPTKPHPLHTDQKKPGGPFCTKHEQKPDDSQEHQTQEDLCPTNLKTEENPPPSPHLNTQQAPPPHHLNTQQAPPPHHLNTQWAPPPPHPNAQRAPPPPYWKTQQAPPPPHLNAQQAPPPPIHLNTQQASHPSAHLNTQRAPPPPYLKTQQALSPPHLNTQKAPPPLYMNTQQAPPFPHLNTQKTPPPLHLNTQQAPPLLHLNTQKTPPPPHLNTQQAPPLLHLNTQQAPPLLHLNTQKTPPLHLNTQQAPPFPHLNTQKTPPPLHLNTQQAPPPHLNTQQAPPFPHLNTQKTPPPLHLNTQQAPPAPHLNTQQAPPPPHLNTQKTPPLHLNTQQAPPFPHLNTQQAAPPPPHLNTQQAAPPFPHLKTQQAPPFPHLNTQQAPPFPHLNTQQAPPFPHLNTQQAPPFPHLNTQQAPPPPHLNTQQAPPFPHLHTQQAPRSPRLNTQQAPPFPHLNTQQAPPSLHLNTQQAPPSPHLNTQQAPRSPRLNTQQDPRSPRLNTQQAPRSPSLNTQQAPLSLYLNTQQASPSPCLNAQQAPPSPHLNTQQAPPFPHLNTQQAPPSLHLNTQQAPPSLHLNTQQAPPFPHLNTQQAPPSLHLNTQQAPPSLHLNTQQAPPSLHLNTQQAPRSPRLNTQQAPPFPHLNTQQAPPSLHLNTQQAPPSLHLNTQQAPPFPHLNTQQAPPSLHLNTQQAPPSLHLNTQQAPPSLHLNTQQAPPSLHLNTQQAPPSPHLNTQQAPLPPHLNTQQAPLSSADQQNHLSSPQVVPSIVPPTEALTLALPVQAPPLTIEVFCDQMWPRPPASPSGEPKLCGYLLKQGGPLRAWKQRWFTYEEKKNQLFYYRTPQDVMPLGRVELCSATFTYPLKAEGGTFHIKTPERTFILKAVTQELMLYWLQQLQVKRWKHRQTSICPDPTNNNNNNTTDDFLPMLKSPLGLVGEEAANVSSQRTPLTNMSIKHPFIEIQNSVHSLRKRASQEWSQSVFHLEAPPWIPPNSADTSNTTGPPAPRTPTEPSPPLLSLADPAGQVSPAEGRESPSLFDSWSRKSKTRSSTMPLRRRDTLSDRTSRLQQEKQMLMEEVKTQKELVWILHKSLEASQLEKRTCAEFLAAEGEQERLELLRHRERQAADLRGRLEEAKAEVEATKRILDQKDAQLVELQDNISMLMEKNNAKQEVIIKLSDQVTSCMSDVNPTASSCSSLDPQTFRQLQQEVENLKDDIEAYKTQNKFLNSEIYQLTKLWRNSSEQEKSLMVKCAYLEASNCQVESRYLGVLRTLQETKSLDPVQRDAVQKRIEDALKEELKNVIKFDMAKDHDEYGFKIIPDYEVDDMKLLAKIQALEIRSHSLLQQEGVERPLLSRWAQYLAGRSHHDLCPSLELKGLLRGGIPQEYRQRVWRWMVRTRTKAIREHHPNRYQQLCDKSRTSPHPASRQIQLDLHRTLTTNQHFSSPSSPALQELRRVLLAFSWQNPDIGYCQGLNRLAAIALLVLQSEEDAFWCLVAVVEAIMPQDYYTKNLVASQADQRVLKDFLVEKLPRLAAHFEDHSIDVSLITFNWFLVIFVESLPSDILLPLWDAFLYEGSKVIFRYALALFKYKEDDILKIHDNVEIYQYLRFFTKTISDSRKLTSIAFNDMNPFPRRLLRNRRVLHLERLQGELRELEEQQREFVTESSVPKDKELDIMVSEDDDEL